MLLDWFYDLDLKIATLGRDDFKKAAKLTQEFHISVYDASYVALARTNLEPTNSSNLFFSTERTSE